jgi:phage/plasmid-associated DNA primase
MTNPIFPQPVKDFTTLPNNPIILVSTSEDCKEKIAPDNSNNSPKTYTDVEIASLIFDDLRKKDSLVYVNGNFMRYGASHWEIINENDILDKIYSYDKSKMESSRVSITDNKAKSILNILKNMSRDKDDMFKNVPIGINCKNGFIKFDDQGNPTPTPPNKDNFCLHTLPGTWNPNPPNFKGSLLEKLFNGAFNGDEDKEEKIKLIGEICGAAALGYGTKLEEPKAIILLGEQAGNGKSQILDILRGLLPEKAVAAIPPGKMSDEKYILKLIGAQLNASDELGTYISISSDVFKTIITGEPITAREIYRSPVTFRSTAQHIFATNVLPPFKGGMDRGVQRRLLVIPFNNVIPHENRILGIGKLIAKKEPDLLLDFAVQGASRLIKQKNFTVPSSSAEALKDWLLDTDPVVEPNHFIRTRQAHDYFKTWFNKSGLKQEYMVGIKTFVARIKANAPKGVVYKHTKEGSCFFGLHVKQY